MLHRLSRVPAWQAPDVCRKCRNSTCCMLERSPRTFSIMLSQMLFQLLLPILIAACCCEKVVVFHTVNLTFKGREGEQLAFGDCLQKLPLVAACCYSQALGMISTDSAGFLGWHKAAVQ